MILADSTPTTWPDAILLIVLLVGLFTLLGWVAYLTLRGKN